MNAAPYRTTDLGAGRGQADFGDVCALLWSIAGTMLAMLAVVLSASLM